MTLAEILYTTFQRTQLDPTEHPAWGNLDTYQRSVWEGVAHAAAVRVREMNAAELEEAASKMYSSDDVSGIEWSAALLRGV